MPTIKSEPGLPIPEEPKKEEPKAESKKDPRADYGFELPDGRKVTMGRPPIPTLVLLPAILGSLKGNNNVEALYNEAVIRAALYVRRIDKTMITHPQDFGEVQRIVTQLGEDGAEMMMQVYEQRFTPPRVEALDDLKK